MYRAFVVLLPALLPAPAHGTQTRLQALDPEFHLAPDPAEAPRFPSSWSAYPSAVWFESAFAGIAGGTAEARAGGYFASPRHPVGLFYGERISGSLAVGGQLAAETDVVTSSIRGAQGHAWRLKLAAGVAWQPSPRARLDSAIEWSWFFERQTVAGIRWDAGVLLPSRRETRPSVAVRERLELPLSERVALLASGWYATDDLTETATWGVRLSSGEVDVRRAVFTDLSDRRGVSLGFRVAAADGTSVTIGAAFGRTRLHRALSGPMLFPSSFVLPYNGVERTREWVAPVLCGEHAVTAEWTVRAGFSARAVHRVSDGLGTSASPYGTSPHVDDVSWRASGAAGVGYRADPVAVDAALSPDGISGGARLDF